MEAFGDLYVGRGLFSEIAPDDGRELLKALEDGEVGKTICP